MPAPIVLFAYDRPSHTGQVLDSLSQNKECVSSTLYIYCDGPKQNAGEKQVERIKAVRAIAKAEKRFLKTIIIEQPVNKGLANSIMDGVTEVLNVHENIIVLEDDLILSPFFLAYMNDALERYKNEMSVGQIGACNFFACGPKFPSAFFIPIPDCLGWATWKNRWQHFNSDAHFLLNQLKEKKLMHQFNVHGSYDLENMLMHQVGNNGTSWAVRWTAVCILNGWLTLYPNPSMTNHLHSDEATNANFDILPPLCKDLPAFKTRTVGEDPEVIKAMKLGYKGLGDHYGNLKWKQLFKLTADKMLRKTKSLIKTAIGR